MNTTRGGNINNNQQQNGQHSMKATRAGNINMIGNRLDNQYYDHYKDKQQNGHPVV